MSLDRLLKIFYQKNIAAEMSIKIPEIRTGYTVGVQTKPDVSSGKVRGQYFEGIVVSIEKKYGSISGISVRKFYKKNPVTRKFLFMNGDIESIQVIKAQRARKAKLYTWSYRQKV